MIVKPSPLRPDTPEVLNNMLPLIKPNREPMPDPGTPDPSNPTSANSEQDFFASSVSTPHFGDPVTSSSSGGLPEN